MTDTIFYVALIALNVTSLLVAFKNKQDIKKMELSLNGRLSQLLISSGMEEFAKGRLEGEAAEKTKKIAEQHRGS